MVTIRPKTVELQTGTYRQRQTNIYNVSSIHTYEQTNHTMKITRRKANKGAFTNFINPWNQEDQSIATGFPPPHIPHFSI
jgi:hypothetical protein